MVRDPLTNKPYIPGSSLQARCAPLREGSGITVQLANWQGVKIHVCKEPDDYRSCDVCHVFGVPAQSWTSQTRLIVRDIQLDENSARRLEEVKTDLPYTEAKWEVAIDRVTSAAAAPDGASPAGAIFSPHGD